MEKYGEINRNKLFYIVLCCSWQVTLPQTLMFGFTYLCLATGLARCVSREARSLHTVADGSGGAKPRVDRVTGPAFPRPTRRWRAVEGSQVVL